MFLSNFVSDVVEPLDITKLLLEQKETIRKADELIEQVRKLNKNNAIGETAKNMYDAGNTLQTPIFDTSKLPVLDKVDKFFNFTDKIGNYLNNPVLIVNAISGVSYWVCLIIAVGGVLFYIIGHKKGLKYTTGSILSYTLIQAVNWGLNLL